MKCHVCGEELDPTDPDGSFDMFIFWEKTRAGWYHLAHNACAYKCDTNCFISQCYDSWKNSVADCSCEVCTLLKSRVNVEEK